LALTWRQQEHCSRGGTGGLVSGLLLSFVVDLITNLPDFRFFFCELGIIIAVTASQGSFANPFGRDYEMLGYA
jgi:hypothetical protein